MSVLPGLLKKQNWVAACRGMTMFLLSGVVLAQVQQPAPPEIPLSAEQQARYEHFTHELRCLVCQNQTIAESQAPLAMDLREQVRKQIAEGKTDADVVAWLTARYGDYVLYRPRFTASTVLLWLGPFLLVLVGLMAALRYARKSSAGPAVAVPDAAALQRLLTEHTSAAGDTRQP